MKESVDFAELGELEQETILGSTLKDYVRYKNSFLGVEDGWAILDSSKLALQPYYYPVKQKMDDSLRLGSEDFLKLNTQGLDKLPRKCIFKRMVWQALSLCSIFFVIAYFAAIVGFSINIGFLGIILAPLFLLIFLILGALSYHNSEPAAVLPLLPIKRALDMVKIPIENSLKCPSCLGQGRVKVRCLSVGPNGMRQTCVTEKQEEKICEVCLGKGMIENVKQKIASLDQFVLEYNRKTEQFNIKMPEINTQIASRNSKIETWNNSGLRRKHR